MRARGREEEGHHKRGPTVPEEGARRGWCGLSPVPPARARSWQYQLRHLLPSLTRPLHGRWVGRGAQCEPRVPPQRRRSYDNTRRNFSMSNKSGILLHTNAHVMDYVIPVNTSVSGTEDCNRISVLLEFRFLDKVKDTTGTAEINSSLDMLTSLSKSIRIYRWESLFLFSLMTSVTSIKSSS